MNASSKTVGLMIEIILATVFFASICCVVLQLLLQAQKLEQYSRDKSAAVACAQSIGDIFRSRTSHTPQDFDLMMHLCYGEALVKQEDQRYIIYLDERMRPYQQEAGSSCFASVTLEDVKSAPAGIMSRVSIQVEKQGTVLFELSVDRYRPGEPGGESNPAEPRTYALRKEC
jgi:hypothetical protein